VVVRLPYANADYLNDAGNMLCVSADTMAKFKFASVEWVDSLEDKIELIKTNNEKTEKVSVRIRLAGEECIITWSQRHLIRLAALYEKT
jgi:CYTH domain-containing protein